MRTALCLGLLALLLLTPCVSFAADALSSDSLSVSFRLPGEELRPGDILYVYVDITNPTEETFKDIPLFAVWTVSDTWNAAEIVYWPAPATGSWKAGDVNYYTVDIPPGTTEMEIVAPFEWKHSPAMGDMTGTWSLFTGMTDPLMTKVIGSVDWQSMFIHF